MSERSWKLDPCPFCGGPPCMVVKLFDGYLDKIKVDSARQLEGLAQFFDGLHLEIVIFCHECGAEGPTVDELIHYVDEIHMWQDNAAGLWNNRHQDNIGLNDGRRWLPWPKNYELQE